MLHKMSQQVVVQLIEQAERRTELKRTFVTAQHRQSSAARVPQRQLSGFHYVSS